MIRVLEEETWVFVSCVVEDEGCVDRDLEVERASACDFSTRRVSAVSEFELVLVFERGR